MRNKTESRLPTEPIQITAALYPGALATSITLPTEILRAGAQRASAGHRGAAMLSIQMAAAAVGEVQVSAELRLRATTSWFELERPDLLILPALWRNPLRHMRNLQPLIQQLPALCERGTMLCAVGSASFLLAEADLLRGRPATTHWNYMDSFARRYPDVQLQRRHLITESDNRFCVGSVNSVADLMVHFVQQWFGPRVSRAVENQFSPEIRNAYSRSVFRDQNANAHHDETVLQAQQWLRDNLARAPGLGEVAAASGLSTRSLQRRFQQATGQSPGQYLRQQRLSAARDLLRRSNLSVQEIGWQIGLNNSSHFTRVFRQQVGMTPLKYRRAARGKLFEQPSSGINAGPGMVEEDP